MSDSSGGTKMDLLRETWCDRDKGKQRSEGLSHTVL